MSEWAGGVIALLGVALGGGLTHISAARQARQQRRWEVVRHKRDKLEELSAVLDEFEVAYRNLSGAAALRLNSGKPMEPQGSRIPAARLNTLVEFYAPEIMETKNELDQLTERYGAVLGEVIGSSSLDNESKTSLLVKVLHGHREIEAKCKELSSRGAGIVQREIADESSDNRFNSNLLCPRRWRSKAGRLS